MTLTSRSTLQLKDLKYRYSEDILENAQDMGYEGVIIPLVRASDDGAKDASAFSDRYTVIDYPYVSVNNVAVEFDANLIDSLLLVPLSEDDDLREDLAEAEELVDTRLGKLEELFIRDWSYACHLCFPVFIIPLQALDSSNPSNSLDLSFFGALLRRLMGELRHAARIIFRMPASRTQVEDNLVWGRWNSLHTMLGFNFDNVQVALTLSREPEDYLAESMDDFFPWATENLTHIFIDSCIFLTNAKGFPVLSKTHQRLVNRGIKFGAQLVLQITESALVKSVSGDFSQECRYFSHLREKYWQIIRGSGPSVTSRYQSVEGYQDVLQVPLQPLMDHLESGTYHVFEGDSIKYELYEEAIYEALLAHKEKNSASDEEIVIMVAGAGRGPIVRCAWNACKRTKTSNYKIYALEKNPSAVVTLKNLSQTEWKDANIEVVYCDMRSWVNPKFADILVSELLGSFGDNELSPECLDGAMRLLKPESGISIPSSYTSYACPVMSVKIHQQLCRIASGVGRSSSSTSEVLFSDESVFSTPYVVYLQNIQALPGSKPKPIFEFKHPNPSPMASQPNERYRRVKFEAPKEANFDFVCHGIAGYFEATLFGNVKLSTVPSTHSPHMFSWFPIYFPLEQGVRLSPGSTLSLAFWRRSILNRQVWYEWSAEAVSQDGSIRSGSKIHNSKGKSYWIGL